MVRLISYECKKHFFKKTILVALLVFSLINVAKIYSVYNTESLLAEPLGGTVTWKQAYAQIFKDFGGEMTVDKINSLLAVYRPLDKKVSDRTATTAFDVPGTYTGNAGTPLDISLGAYIAVSVLSKTLGVVSLCMCFLFLANLFKNALLPFIFSFLAFLGLLACFEMFAGSSQMLIKTVNPFALIVNHELFHKTEFVNLFGMPVPSFMFALVIGGIWILVFGLLILLTSRTNTVTRGKKICG